MKKTWAIPFILSLTIAVSLTTRSLAETPGGSETAVSTKPVQLIARGRVTQAERPHGLKKGESEIITLTFWNVGEQVPGCGEAALVTQIVGGTKKWNPHRFTGTFSGGLNGEFKFSQGIPDTEPPRLVDGKTIRLNGVLLTVERPVSTPASSMNSDKAVQTLNEIAGVPAGKCAKNIQQALEAGGVKSEGHPMAARDYGPYLLSHGFTEVSADGYEPKKGDIVVIQATPGGPKYGHIAMFDGNQWISDHKQKDFAGNINQTEQARKAPHKFYRPWPGSG